MHADLEPTVSKYIYRSGLIHAAKNNAYNKSNHYILYLTKSINSNVMFLSLHILNNFTPASHERYTYKIHDNIILIQWNLSITALRIKDTSVIRTAIDSPKRSTIETCTYFTSELRTPLYSILRTHDPDPNGHIAWLTNSILGSRPRPRVPSL